MDSNRAARRTTVEGMGTSSGDAKIERLLNLVLALLATRRPLSKSTLRRQVPQYEQVDDTTFDRMFERDKDELRELGIPLIAAPIDAFFDDEIGYRIDRRDYSLPPITFTTAEVEALRLASRTWSESSMAPQAASAIRKLAAAGVEGDDAELLGPDSDGAEDMGHLVVSTDSPAFEPLKGALLARRAVRFEYRKSGDAGNELRQLQPWQLQAWHGRWYVTGFDLDRQQPRLFRLDRITSAVKAVGRGGAYTIPDQHDALTMIRRQVDPSGQGEAVVFVARRAGAALRLRGQQRDRPAPPPGFDTVAVEYADIDRLAGELARYGPDVIAAEPAELRVRVVALLRGALAAGEGGPR